jgi:hypothetical protein
VTVAFGRRLPQAAQAIKRSLEAFIEGASEKHRRRMSRRSQSNALELVIKQRETSMTKFWKKFVWSPAFWASLGLLGCVTGLYFQRVASNGSGLWCLGLMFLGAAYIERKDLF